MKLEILILNGVNELVVQIYVKHSLKSVLLKTGSILIISQPTHDKLELTIMVYNIICKRTSEL